VNNHIWILPHHLRDFRRNDFALLTPCRGALEDGDAFVHDGFEVFGFGVEGGDFGGRHCESICITIEVGGCWMYGISWGACVLKGLDAGMWVRGFTDGLGGDGEMGERDDVIVACLGKVGRLFR
jgi:hypothetical protein